MVIIIDGKFTNIIYNKTQFNKVRSNLISIFLINTVVLFTLSLIGFTYLHSTSIENYFKENVNTPLGLPFWGVSKFKKDGDLYEESKIFVLDQYIPFKENYDSYMKKLGYEDLSDKFKKEIQ